MPGILPMKVIKVGNSAQSRIAQACDRCRSKKIRCDGVRPTCSQCANVGFECRTSDKLSRRAFPRGYTESLEERVRQLEAEVRDLKDLLDEKDEKIDMLSKMHTNRCRRPSSDAPSSRSSPEAERNAALAKEDKFRVQAPALLLGVDNSDSYFMGASSGRAFIEAFKRKLQEHGKPCGDFAPEAFLHMQGPQRLSSQDLVEQPSRVPPRLLTDRAVNVYFQEWAPLFPVLHKPTFLALYEEFVADPEKVKDQHKIAQLYLVFSIAGLSIPSPDTLQLAVCEKQWTQAVDTIMMDNTMSTLQCLIMAILCCIMRADYKRLHHYKGIAVGLSHRLGLHQSQKRFSFGALTIETRKKVFWTLYTLDCFSAAILGLPKFLKEDDIQTEYPSDTDDEYVTEKGFQPSLPGEHTRLSSALALFEATRVLARVLEQIYPTTTPYELSLQQLGTLCGELDSWYENLPSHLRLNFAQDKPSTDVTGSRSPLLALAYHFIRTLIYRPAVGSSLGAKAAPALLSIGDSSKHIVQIIQLLEERSMTFAFCLNKLDLLVMCGMTLLYRTVDLSKDSKLMRDDERLINAVLKLLEKAKAPRLGDVKRVAAMLVSLDGPRTMPPPTKSFVRPATSSPKSPTRSPSQRKTKCSSSRHNQASASETDLMQQQEKLRRMTMSSIEGLKTRPRQTTPRTSFDSLMSSGLLSQQGAHLYVSEGASDAPGSGSKSHTDYGVQIQEDLRVHSYAQMAPVPVDQSRALLNGHGVAKSYGLPGQEWETMLASLDHGVNNVYDAIYGGPGFGYESTVSAQVYSSSWSPDSVDLSAFHLGEVDTCIRPAQSVHSLSEESLSSGEEAAPSEMGLAVGGLDYENPGLAINCSSNEGFIFEGLEGFTL